MADVPTVIRRIRRCEALRRLDRGRLTILCGRLEAKRCDGHRQFILAWLASAVLAESEVTSAEMSDPGKKRSEQK